MLIRAFAHSHVGVGPAFGGRERNEDNYLLCHQDSIEVLKDNRVSKQTGVQGKGMLLAVCDGLGGHADGHLASQAAVQVLSKLFRSEPAVQPERQLLQYLHQTHDQLYEKVSARGPVKMGTTVTIAWIIGEHLYWSQVGDSSLMLLRDNILRQITPVHTRAEFLRRDGRPPEPDTNYLVQSFIYGSRGFGHNQRLRLDEDHDCGYFQLQPNDKVLLCSDGLEPISPKELTQLLSHHPVVDLPTHLVQRAMDLGSTDNCTAVVVSVEASGLPT